MKINKKISRKSAIITGWLLVIFSLFYYGVLFFGGAKGFMSIVFFIFTTFFFIIGIRFIKGNHKYKNEK